MKRYESWDGFCSDVFDHFGESGRFLQMIYGAGGIALILWIISMLGFSPFLFITSALGFLITPPGLVVGALFGATAVFVLKEIFFQRHKLKPVLERLVQAKLTYESIEARYPDPSSFVRKACIDKLFTWVLEGGTQPEL